MLYDTFIGDNARLGQLTVGDEGREHPGAHEMRGGPAEPATRHSPCSGKIPRSERQSASSLASVGVNARVAGASTISA